MSVQMYCASLLGAPQVSLVDVVRHNEDYLWLPIGFGHTGKRAWRTSSEAYFRTRQEAVDWLAEALEYKIQALERRLALLRSDISDARIETDRPEG